MRNAAFLFVCRLCIQRRVVGGVGRESLAQVFEIIETGRGGRRDIGALGIFVPGRDHDGSVAPRVGFRIGKQIFYLLADRQVVGDRNDRVARIVAADVVKADRDGRYAVRGYGFCRIEIGLVAGNLNARIVAGG